MLVSISGLRWDVTARKSAGTSPTPHGTPQDNQLLKSPISPIFFESKEVGRRLLSNEQSYLLLTRSWHLPYFRILLQPWRWKRALECRAMRQGIVRSGNGSRGRVDRTGNVSLQLYIVLGNMYSSENTSLVKNLRDALNICIPTCRLIFLWSPETHGMHHSAEFRFSMKICSDRCSVLCR